jgi:uncharacterized membrane protein
MKNGLKCYPHLLLIFVLLLASSFIACTCPAPPPAPSIIAASPSSFSFITETGKNPSTQTLGIQNSGEGTLDWSITDDADWLNLSPTSGGCSGEQTDDVVVSVDVTGVITGDYTATITISAPDASNSPHELLVDLTITPVIPPTAEYGVSLAVSPESQTGLPDDTLYYSITVTNTGTRADTYNLSIIDDQGWTPACPSTTSEIASVASDIITISLTIPEDADLETENEIAIVATSQNDATASDSITCLAMVTEEQQPPPSGVSVSISPSTTTVSPGDTFTIDVVVDSETKNVHACDIEVSYSSTIFTAGTVTEAELLGTAGSDALYLPLMDVGKVSYGGVRLSDNPAAPVSGTFVSIEFEVNQAIPSGDYNLNVDATINDGTGYITGIVYNDGLVTVL